MLFVLGFITGAIVFLFLMLYSIASVSTIEDDALYRHSGHLPAED